MQYLPVNLIQGCLIHGFYGNRIQNVLKPIWKFSKNMPRNICREFFQLCNDKNALLILISWKTSWRIKVLAFAFTPSMLQITYRIFWYSTYYIVHLKIIAVYLKSCLCKIYFFKLSYRNMWSILCWYLLSPIAQSLQQ